MMLIIKNCIDDTILHLECANEELMIRIEIRECDALVSARLYANDEKVMTIAETECVLYSLSGKSAERMHVCEVELCNFVVGMEGV